MIVTEQRKYGERRRQVEVINRIEEVSLVLPSSQLELYFFPSSSHPRSCCRQIPNSTSITWTTHDQDKLLATKNEKEESEVREKEKKGKIS